MAGKEIQVNKQWCYLALDKISFCLLMYSISIQTEFYRAVIKMNVHVKQLCQRYKASTHKLSRSLFGFFFSQLIHGSLTPSPSTTTFTKIVSSLMYFLVSTSSWRTNFAPPKLAFFSILGRPRNGSFSAQGLGLMLNLMCFRSFGSSFWSSKKNVMR